MVSKLKQRRTRRLKSDIAWWMAEAKDWQQIAMERDRQAPQSGYPSADAINCPA